MFSGNHPYNYVVRTMCYVLSRQFGYFVNLLMLVNLTFGQNVSTHPLRNFVCEMFLLSLSDGILSSQFRFSCFHFLLSLKELKAIKGWRLDAFVLQVFPKIYSISLNKAAKCVLCTLQTFCCSIERDRVHFLGKPEGQIHLTSNL